MKIRRYLGNNTQEAILKVKMDLGNNAVILNTRKVRQKGLLKFFAKPLVEVLAAVDDDYSIKDHHGTRESATKEHIVKREKELPRQEEKVQPTLSETTAVKTVQHKIISEEKEEKLHELENKVNSMESLLRKIYEQVKIPAQKVEINIENEAQRNYSKILEVFYNNLVKNEVDSEIAKKIIDMVKEKCGVNTNVNDSATVLYNVISEILGKPETIALRGDSKPTVVIFVGPTGVGKTTTLAKIAANYALNNKRNVGLITADTYRIAAVEQLKTYAEILGMPVAVIYSPNEIKDAIKQHSDKDIILIDTAGRSHRNKSQFEELKALVTASEPDEVYLVLSATTSVNNCKEILRNYEFIKNYKLIFTKLDETPITGLILNIKEITNKSISYVTTGQSVPDDIEVANIDKITKNLLGSIT